MTPDVLDAPVRGPSYSVGMRTVGLFAFVALLGYVVRRWDVIAAGGWSSPAALVVMAAFFGLAGSIFFMLRSVTILDQHGLVQSGLMEKKMAWSEVRTARFVRWGAARLIVRGERGPFTVFYGGSDELKAAFERIARAYRQ